MRRIIAVTYATIRCFLCVFLLLIPALYLLLSLSILLLMGRHSYTSILQWFHAWRPDAFDPVRIAGQGFTPGWYAWVQGYRVPFMAGIVLVLILYCFFSRQIWAFSLRLWKEGVGVLRVMANVYRHLSVAQRGWLWLVFGAIWCYRVYDFFAYPIHPDEACSYLYFARQGWLVTATNYTLPNNHTLFNLICAGLCKIPGLSPKAVLRLPSMIADTVLFYGLFCLICRWKGFTRALLVVIWAAPSYMISYYAAHGRGYQIQDICALIGGMAAWACWCGEGREGRKGYALFIISSVAGLYINLTYLYHFTALVLMVGHFAWERREMGTFRSFFEAVGMIGVLTVILYLPLVLASGWGALNEGTKWQGVEGYGWLITGFPDLAFDFKMIFNFGRPGFWMGLGLGLGIFYLYRTKKITGAFYQHSVAYLTCVAISMIIWSLHAKRYPMDRTLCFLALAIHIFFINTCYDLWKRYFPRIPAWVFGGIVLLKTLGSIRSVLWEGWAPGRSHEVAAYLKLRADLEKLAVLHPSSWQVTWSDDYYPMYLRVYLAEKEEKSKVIWDRDSARGEVLFLPECYRSFSLSGYHLWAEGKLTGLGNHRMDIYVRDRLLSKGDH